MIGQTFAQLLSTLPADQRTAVNRRLADLIEKARHVRMTDDELAAQRVSFAYGNVHMANDSVTREDIERAAQRVTAPET